MLLLITWRRSSSWADDGCDWPAAWEHPAASSANTDCCTPAHLPSVLPCLPPARRRARRHWRSGGSSGGRPRSGWTTKCRAWRASKWPLLHGLGVPVAGGRWAARCGISALGHRQHGTFSPSPPSLPVTRRRRRRAGGHHAPACASLAPPCPQSPDHRCARDKALEEKRARRELARSRDDDPEYLPKGLDVLGGGGDDSFAAAKAR